MNTLVRPEIPTKHKYQISSTNTSLFLSTAVVVAAKSTSDAYSSKTAFPPGPNSPQSTISTVEREIKEAGGEAAAFAVDVRDFASLQDLVDKTIKV